MYHLSLLQMLSAPCWSGNTILTPELSYHILSSGLHANGILYTVICSTATAVQSTGRESEIQRTPIRRNDTLKIYHGNQRHIQFIAAEQKLGLEGLTGILFKN